MSRRSEERAGDNENEHETRKKSRRLEKEQEIRRKCRSGDRTNQLKEQKIRKRTGDQKKE